MASLIDPQWRLIDVRQPAEYNAGYIEGSELIPLGCLAKSSETWDRQDPLTIICRSGRRAEMAVTQLKARGFQDVLVLRGGVERWASGGKPLLRSEQAIPASARWAAIGSVAVITISLLLARSVSPWFLLPVGFLAMRLARTWWKRLNPRKA